MIIKAILGFFKHYFGIGVSCAFMGVGVIGILMSLWSIITFHFIDGILSLALSIALIFIGYKLFMKLYGHLVRKVKVKFKDLGDINEIIIPKQKDRIVEIIEKGKKEKWGNLITYFYFEHEELWCFESGALIIARDEVSNNNKFSVFVPKSELGNCLKMYQENGVVVISIDVQGQKLEIVVDSQIVQEYPVMTKIIARFKALYEDINKEYVDSSVQDYKEFCYFIENVKNDGFKLGSYNVNLNTLTVDKFAFYRETIGLLGKNDSTGEIFLTYNNEIIKDKHHNMYYHIKGLIEKDVKQVIDNKKRARFSLDGAVMGYFLAGPVGAGAMAVEEDTRTRYKLEEEIIDNRVVLLNINGIEYELPFTAYGLLKELYPNSEKVVYQNVSI
ncbi:hypothetical protein [Clostridium celatum]|uniref:hypothetical protein n=1 Tax=Clostridium celatum TaxID=36834 RepID=UPI001897B7AF|nr:hypothetical protein [Clostridium celatum]